MRYSISRVMTSANLKYDNDDTQRKEWVLEFPCQVVIAIDSLYWTKITEENYLNPENEADLEEWYNF